MRVGIDVRKYSDFGIGTYIRNLLTYFTTRSDIALQLIASPDQETSLSGNLNMPVHTNRSRKYSLRELVSVGKQANRLGVDVFHAPHYTLPYGLRPRSVVTIHDLIHLRFPEYFSVAQRTYARLLISHACNAADAVIVDAEFTKADLLSSFNIPSEKIHVIPLGVASLFVPAESAIELKSDLASMGVTGPYILYSGGLKPHKNVATLLRAFSQLRTRGSARLVISGENFWDQTELATLARDLGITESILNVPADQQRLLRLYQGATAVVVPSRYEGFGLPILEAMACGTPVIGARAASIPEVMGEGGLMFDPLRPEELTDRMEMMFDDGGLRLAQRAYGLQNAARFSWELCGARTMEVYRAVVGGGSG